MMHLAFIGFTKVTRIEKPVETDIVLVSMYFVERFFVFHALIFHKIRAQQKFLG